MGIAALFDLFTPLDAIAVACLLIAYKAIGILVEHPVGRRRSVTLMMSEFRRNWMVELAQRENRIFDSQIIGSLRASTSFFASTSIIAIGGVLAVAGNAETLRTVTGGLLSDDRPVEVHQLKLVTVALFLVAAFLHFVWSNRIFGYCSVVMASVPAPGNSRAMHVAAQAGELGIRAAYNFNRGLRAVYFALTAATWMIGPIPLIVATLATLWTLWEREFRSHPHRILARGDMP
ncbi:DUF599 domain-containing protein [Roseitranquillus sediminis]|uniref:DUF599 domain-containing protein n=1 Tax=Roseitranquillus sediminis TaxID=2809051 RepID=UPI001D0CDC6D|nr:DUF599 domain-containing protein [Roseitranquillus sediminis]MBM9594849.1 DUF599 domain-containing protein [Roseitranquillus sediminis]